MAGDYVFYVTKNSQILKMKYSLEKPEDIGKFSYLQQPFC